MNTNTDTEFPFVWIILRNYINAMTSKNVKMKTNKRAKYRKKTSQHEENITKSKEDTHIVEHRATARSHIRTKGSFRVRFIWTFCSFTSKQKKKNTNDKIKEEKNIFFYFNFCCCIRISFIWPIKPTKSLDLMKETETRRSNEWISPHIAQNFKQKCSTYEIYAFFM